MSQDKLAIILARKVTGLKTMTKVAVFVLVNQYLNRL